MTRDTGFPADVVEKIWDRDGGCCAGCGNPQRRDRRGEPFDGWSVHHREPRGRLGIKGRPWVSAPANGVILCGTGTNGCHGWFESHRKVAIRQGFIVSALGITRPVAVPVRHAIHGWVLLDDGGHYATTDGPSEAAA